ncbi:adenylate/guanylate cyclase domain-containing protein [Intrasporangium calvum]|uniref:Adenylate/guanylate cyclase domain-containing protein n=1 Tax=Intrasporangium calvum TaxID=53358 RepID=A0ABT5GGH7_9MICO|nr:adenylate/guanylate cyclase domain-containing protein [Intrasporangium calvum]MDC5697326.1 adenylate/guanylate cyclase domain-containing protein [Intrasporangium calvum]
MGGSDQKWTPEDVRLYMMGVHPGLAEQRARFRRFPSEPRCKLCMVPFGGIGGAAFRLRGFARSSNPLLCTKCTTELGKSGLSGVEIPCTLLFSDVRGSTALGERMTPSDFHAFLDRFYKIATKAIVDHDGVVDKLVGDEVIGLFFGGVSGPDHAGAAIRAALDLADRAGLARATPMGPIPIGTAVHTGDVFVGATGEHGTVEDFTALGDAVNTTARLASAAGAGEVLVSCTSGRAAHLPIEDREHRLLEIRGRSEPIEVVVLRGAGSGVTA